MVFSFFQLEMLFNKSFPSFRAREAFFDKSRELSNQNDFVCLYNLKLIMRSLTCNWYNKRKQLILATA